MIAVLRQRNYALLWSAALLSGVGNFMLVAALPYFVYSTSGSVLASAAIFASEMAPMVVMPAIGGIFADRWKRKSVLVASDWVRGLILLPLLAVHGTSTLWIVYVVAFEGAVVGNFAGPFGSAAIPHVVGPRQLPAANSAFSIAASGAALLGFPFGGLLLARVGLWAVVTVDAVSFVLSGLLVLAVRVALEERADKVTLDEASALPRAWREWLRGVEYVRSQRWISLVFLVVLVTFLGNGMIWAVLPAFVRGQLGGSAQFYSWVLTAQGAGGIAAGFAVGWVTRRFSPGQLLAWGLFVLGLLPVVTAVAVSRPVTLLGLFLAGPPALLAVASLNTLLQSDVPDSYRGRVSGAYLTLNALASLSGSITAGVLADRVGSRFMLGMGGAIFVIAGVLAVRLLLPALTEMRGDLKQPAPSSAG
jgi:MFS family permease